MDEKVLQTSESPHTGQWFYEHNGKPIGPISGTVMRDWIKRGQISRTQRIRKGGEQAWRNVGDCPELCCEESEKISDVNDLTTEMSVGNKPILIGNDAIDTATSPKSRSHFPLLSIGVVCLCISLAMLYYFMNVYDASAGNGPVYIGGGKIWGAGFEDHQRRLRIWEAGKTLSGVGICCGIIISVIGGILRGVRQDHWSESGQAGSEEDVRDNNKGTI